MISARDAVISTLVACKLSARRLLRQWHKRGTGAVERGAAERPVLYSDGLDNRTDDDDWHKDSSRGKRGQSSFIGSSASHASKMLTRGARLPITHHDGPRKPYAVCVVLFLAALFVRLWRISQPPSIVFDELHFGKFVKAYWLRQYYFDIHPPLGKLILYGVSRLFSSHAPKTDFKFIGEKFGPEDAVYLPMRVSSSLFGSSVPPLTYLIAREMGLSFPASLVPACAQIFDNLVITESRLILMDAQLLCFMSACLLCALRLWGSRKRTQRRTIYLIATAVFGSLALSVKWTALATPSLVALVSLFGVPFPRQGMLEFEEMAVAGAVAVFLYATFFYIHFALLPLSGFGDKFMRNEFQMTLLGNSQYNASALRPSFLNNFLYINVRMFSASAHIKTRHTWESKWYQWVISHRGVLYHVNYSTETASKIYLIGNPVVIYTALLSVICFAVVTALIYFPKLRANRLSSYDKFHGFTARGMFLLAGYVLNLVPYIAVERCTFLYHYVPALFYGELLLANNIHLLPVRYQRPVAVAIVSLMVLAFWWWSPWIYGTELSPKQHKRRALYGESWT